MRLVIAPESARPKVNGGKGILGRFRARAWRSGDAVVTTWRYRNNVPLLAHEVEHDLPDFLSNDDHHPWWHLCGRAVPVIGVRHLTQGSIETAKRLRPSR